MHTREQISLLAEKWLNGTISEAEKQLFEAWYNRRKPDEIHWLGNTTEDAVRNRIFESVKVQITDQEDAVLYSTPATHRFRKLKWGMTAAFLMLATALFFLYNNAKQVVVVHKQLYQDSVFNPAPPSGVKAILTLADGREVLLDSLTGDNTIIQGAGALQKRSTGELVYSQGKHSSSHNLINKITVPRGSQILSVVLCDGTKVWLNVESSLQYPVVFNGNERKVNLTGEAYFEVSKMAGKKFIVETAGSETEVLGTHFNINSYKPDGEQITLLEGSVKVQNSITGARELKPGEQAVVAQQGIQLKQSPDLEAVMAWKNGLFKLNNADLYTIMGQLSRWYDVEVGFEGNLEGKTFSGIISRNTQLNTVLDMLAMTKEVRFKTNGKTITVIPY